MLEQRFTANGDAMREWKSGINLGRIRVCRAICILGVLCAPTAQAQDDTPSPSEDAQEQPAAPTGAPFAAIPPEDTVTLRSGAIYFGQIVEKVPGDHEILKLATGEIKRFTWADLVQSSPQQPPALGDAASSVRAIEMLAVPPGERVLVKLDSDNPYATIEQLTGRQAVSYEVDGNTQTDLVDSPRTICTAPCGVELSYSRLGQNSSYRIGGDGVVTSDWFNLPKTPGSLELHVKTGSATGKSWGQLLTWGGFAIAVGAVTPLLIGLETQTAAVPPLAGCLRCTGLAGNDNAGLIDVSVGVIIGGIVMIAAGIPLWAINHTSVIADGGEQLAQSGPASNIRWAPAGFTF